MLKSLLMASALTMAFSGAAMAAPVTGSVVADNHAVVVLENGGTKTIVTGSGGSWPSAKTFTFNIPEQDEQMMKRCKIHIIAWGDGSDAQGIAAHFAGAMSASTGSAPFVIGSVPNSTTGGIFPTGGAATSITQVNAILAGLGTQIAPGWTSLPVGVGGISGTWGPVVMPALGPNPAAYPASFRFIWDTPTLGNNAKNYRVATLPCDQLQKPEEPPISMPGNHWQCYRVVEGPTLKPESLTVRDQFGKAEIVLARPLMLCNPSLKVHGDKKYGVEFQERHLVCYQPVKQSDQAVKRKVKINNQMAPATLVLAERQMFCVPSSKKRLDAPDQPVALPMD